MKLPWFETILKLEDKYIFYISYGMHDRRSVHHDDEWDITLQYNFFEVEYAGALPIPVGQTRVSAGKIIKKLLQTTDSSRLKLISSFDTLYNYIAQFSSFSAKITENQYFELKAKLFDLLNCVAELNIPKDEFFYRAYSPSDSQYLDFHYCKDIISFYKGNAWQPHIKDRPVNS